MAGNFPALDGPGSCDQPESIIFIFSVYAQIVWNATGIYGGEKIRIKSVCGRKERLLS